MALRAEYINAIETRLRWLKWTRSVAGQRHIKEAGFWGAYPIYDRMLSTGETYYMAPHFSQLVENARRTVPDDLAFEKDWLLTQRGWLLCDVPFEVPPIHMATDAAPETRMIRAIGWETVPAGSLVHVFPGGSKLSGHTTRAGIQFACFQERPSQPYHAWSYFLIEDGMSLGHRISTFESTASQMEPGSEYVAPPEAGAVIGTRETHPLHEIRWIYTALHLMAQRLAIVAQHSTDRATRRRHEGTETPAPPFIRVVTLRRLTFSPPRQRNDEPADVDWRWQWSVEGHWRFQWYPGEGVHKRIWIEEFVKGPADKPLKPKTITMFKADR
jgi:hypothetical protein